MIALRASWTASRQSITSARSTRSRQRRHDRRRPCDRMGGIPRRGGAASGAGRTHDHPARQSRPQHRRPPQPGTARSAVQPVKRLRQMRALSAIAAVQGHRVLVVDPMLGKAGTHAGQTLAPHRQRIADFADIGSLRLSMGLGRLWDDQFPMILPPATADGLGSCGPQLQCRDSFLVHQCAWHGLGRADPQACRRRSTRFPHAHWIIALHHHLIEYPMSVAALSERVGTALINGSWFVRKLQHNRAAGDRHARPSPYRLDRAVRQAEDHFGPVAGDGREERGVDLFSYSHPDVRSRAASFVCFRRNAWRLRARMTPAKSAGIEARLLGLALHRSAEQIRQPSGGRTLIAERKQSKGNWHAYECPE